MGRFGIAQEIDSRKGGSQVLKGSKVKFPARLLIAATVLPTGPERMTDPRFGPSS